MNLDELRAYKSEILAVARENGISNVRVFGPVARGDADEKSDVDLLVKAGEEVGMEFFSFCLKAEEILKCKVDVLSDNAINRHIKERILSEAVAL